MTTAAVTTADGGHCPYPHSPPPPHLAHRSPSPLYHHSLGHGVHRGMVAVPVELDCCAGRASGDGLRYHPVFSQGGMVRPAQAGNDEAVE